MLAFMRGLEGLLNREASAYVWVDDPKTSQNPHQDISKNITLYKAASPEKTAGVVLFFVGEGGEWNSNLVNNV